MPLNDTYCECGQYLTKFFHAMSQILSKGNCSVCGIECPNKLCDKSYTLSIADKTGTGTKTVTIMLRRTPSAG